LVFGAAGGEQRECEGCEKGNEAAHAQALVGSSWRRKRTLR
jgi:hypothetical protein